LRDSAEVEQMAITIKDDTFELETPDLGVTMRTLLAAAATGAKRTGRRAWTVRYKSAVIGSVRVRLTSERQKDGNDHGTSV